jgi:hypothetical protein
MAQTAVHGSQSVVYINSVVFGVTNSITFMIDYNVTTNRGIDVMGPVEITPESYKISGQMKLWKLVLDGGPEGYGVLPPLQQLSLGKYLSMAIYDRSTGTVIFNSDTVIFKSQRWDIRSKALVEGTLEFEALDYTTYSPNGSS